MDVEKQKKIIKEKCELCNGKNVVFGDGPLDANIMFIGEAPGFNEDRLGKPFVGRAGKFLDELLKTVNLNRRDVYISNIVKCRPPKNRDPTPEEINQFYPFLDLEIKEIKPKIIIPLGRHATKTIFERYNLKFDGISVEHGKIYKVSTLFGEIKIAPMYHPAAAIYNPNLKDVLKEDLKKIIE